MTTTTTTTTPSRGGGGEEGSAGSLDSLAQWIEERQRAFKHWERAFFSPPASAALALQETLISPRLAQDEATTTATTTPYYFNNDFKVIPEQDNDDDKKPPYYFNNDFRVIPEEANDDKMLSRKQRDLDGGGGAGGDLSPKARVTYDEGRFQVEFDVRDYRPEELSIKTEGDVLIVLAKHETKTEPPGGGSFVSRQFEQRFTLPSGVRPEAITSALSKEGTLTVTAPREHRQGREGDKISG